MQGWNPKIKNANLALPPVEMITKKKEYYKWNQKHKNNVELKQESKARNTDNSEKRQKSYFQNLLPRPP